MKILVTGSSGHLGEAMMRTLRGSAHEVRGLDVVAGEFTEVVGSVADREVVAEAVAGCQAIVHTATLHKPHVETHTRQQFVDTNISGTLNLLEEAVQQGCESFIFTSTTSTFGRALVPPAGEPTAWITEDLRPVPKNIYGTSKVAAEDLCELFHLKHGLPCLILKTSRFFPEEDDNAVVRGGFDDLNMKVNELLYRRLDVEDAVHAHLLALERAQSIGFGRYILSATPPFNESDLGQLRHDPATIIERLVPFQDEYARRGWRMVDQIDRVYSNATARKELGWKPRFTFGYALERLRNKQSPFSQLAADVGSKGYHPGLCFEDGPFPVRVQDNAGR